jgi:phosphoribosylformylglycinamidine synthase I
MAGMKAGIITFLGSNCDDDALYALGDVLKADTRRLYYDETSLPGLDLVVLPGGFSYGDYLRCGAIARFSPIMPAVKEFADAGGLVIGICNGFQILTEAQMLPGALIRNECVQFRCKWVHLRVENPNTPFTDGRACRRQLH